MPKSFKMQNVSAGFWEMQSAQSGMQKYTSQYIKRKYKQAKSKK